MEMKNHYDILEVSPRARSSVIEAAYRTLMKEYHPDKSSNNGKYAESLNNARSVLKDPDKRKEYDRNARSGRKVIGNYKIIEKIAEGGFGTTYKGEHIITGSPVCIKHAHEISSDDERILIDEARAVWDLRHYGIPPVRDVLKLEDGSFALVTGYVPGPTLDQIVEKTRGLDPEDLAWIVSRSLNTLKYLHYHGVVHGDIKPKNIIIQPESHAVVLVDYGLSAVRPTKDEENKGYTPYFASPEQEAGGVLLPQSDFYSLGMTMIHSLGGDVKRKAVPVDVPDAFAHFIKRCIVREVLSRPCWNSEDLCEDFENVRKKCFGRSSSGFKKIRGWEK